MHIPDDDESREQELNQMFELCIQAWKGQDIRETLGQLVACWDVSPGSARLMLVAFKAGMEFGCDLAVEPTFN